MVKKRPSIDKVRASRDGHEFHEAWAARKALQLLLPVDRFIGIAVEGLSPVDEPTVSATAVEIADLVLYYGKHPTFSKSEKVSVLQFKYSIGSENLPFRLSDARKTIQKFVTSLRDHKKTYSASLVEKKLHFELVTNRPISSDFLKAIKGIRSGVKLQGDAAKQAKQLKSASRLRGKELVSFAKKLSVTGLAGSLGETKRKLSRTIVDWSSSPDTLSRARLHGLKQLLRDKAGSAGKGDNLITQTDVLAVLELQEPEDLLPCPDSFPEIGQVVTREQLKEVGNLIPTLNKPLLIHADGGVGKTVFMQSLATMMKENHQVILFDCFGGGAYRAPEDARHLPRRGLIHIVNSLACAGLCDPLLPSNANVDELMQAFRRRLSQTVQTLQRGSQQTQLLLFLDAIDNAAEHAKDKSEPCFPKLLLESFHHNGPVPGVQIIVSCRSYRISLSKGDADCEEVGLNIFSESEARKYLLGRIRNLTRTELRVAYARSVGNPRILEHLAKSGRGLLDSSEINKVILLDDLLRIRIQEALKEALHRGYKEQQIESFLAGLSVLPPPVPVSDYADAHGMAESAILSFAADLAPLLERTKHGMMFRDEPTETFIRNHYAAKREVLNLLANNLFRKQGTSVYAARALPGLLQKLDDGEALFKLAFDERLPESITSTVAKREIRSARITAAVLHASKHNDFNHLVHLLIELSIIASVNQRGAEFVIQNPDLVIASREISATRRLFETRTHWPGKRHSRLTIANVLSGELDEADRHVTRAYEWINHYYRQDDTYHRDVDGPNRIDIASVHFCLVARGRIGDAISFLNRWKVWYTYEVCEALFGFLNQAESSGPAIPKYTRRFIVEAKSEIGAICAALSFRELDNKTRRILVTRLGEACAKQPTIDLNKEFQYTKHYRLQDGLLKGAAIGTSINLRAQALLILRVVPEDRPNLWAFNDRLSSRDVPSFILAVALRAAASGEIVTDHAILPSELFQIAPKDLQGEGVEFRTALKKAIEERYQAEHKLPKGEKFITHDLKQAADRFIDERMEQLIQITRAFVATIVSDSQHLEQTFSVLLTSWGQIRDRRSRYGSYGEPDRFLDGLARRLVLFSLWTRAELTSFSVDAFLSKVDEYGGADPDTLIEVVTTLARRNHLHDLAGVCAIKAARQIEAEHDVEGRSSLFARLARAILPASKAEAAGYFQKALEQLDAIGSGDYTFTNELLLFAASLKGRELEEREFHTLTNICELNIPDEAEKFPWPAFAQGLSRVAGGRALAKLARWDDRSKISLDHTLMPYVIALLQDKKMQPELALSLLRLCDPSEPYGYGSEELAAVIAKKRIS